MLKVKLCLVSVAIISGVLGAVAGNSKRLCENQPQYYKSGSSYFPAGDFGTDFVCYNTAGTCTYYLANPYDPNSYTPCRTGTFVWAFKHNR